MKFNIKEKGVLTIELWPIILIVFILTFLYIGEPDIHDKAMEFLSNEKCK